MKRPEIEASLRRELARIVGEPVDGDGARSLSELGVDSLGYCRVSAFIDKEFGVSVRPEALFELPSVDATITHVMELRAAGESAAPASGPAPARPEPAVADARDIAIVGIAVNLPGAENVARYWELIERGEAVIRPFPADRDPEPLTEPPGYLQGGFVADVAGFDAAFFGISPREAIAMDPQQRLLLECVWHAFEDAGYSRRRLSGSNTSVFVGASSFDYFELLLRTRAARTTHIGTGLSHAVLANRVSQYWNLKGASEAIDTACSSGLVALWRAVEALRSGQSDLALVGGVNVLATRTPFQIFADAGMLSPQGLCLPFDERAAGYVRGEGVACVVVKRAADARRDGDRIWAVIKGGAVRHSGHTNSLTAPNPDAQADVIVAAIGDAGVDPASIGYVEAHGTGTSLGDPIEARALQRAFGRLGARPGFALGSVKAQIGHLEAAAGLAGLVKAALALDRGWLPGNRHLRSLNHHLDLSDATFHLPAEGAPWVGPRRAGVSSFGFGGVNAHVVLEAVAPEARAAGAPGPRAFLLSAASAEALTAQAAALAAEVVARRFEDEGAERAFLAALAFTLARRSVLPHRRAVVAGSAAELVERLRAPQPAPGVFAGVAKRRPHDLLALFDDESELATRLGALASKGEWHKLAALWVEGLEVDWEALVARDAGPPLALPGYPFTHERYWPTSAPQPADRAAFYAARWMARPLAGRQATSEKPFVALIAGERGRKVAEALQSLRAVAVQPLGASPAVAEIGGLVDLTALDGDAGRTCAEVCHKLELVRRVLGGALKRGERLAVVQATCGLAAIEGAPTTLAGAAEAAVYASLWAEYRHCRSRTVDFDPTEFDPGAVAAVLHDELDADDACEIAYRAGERRARVVVPIAAPARAAEPPRGAAFITGATGAIATCLLQDLAARGVRAFLLTGRRAPSPEEQRRWESIERQGAAVVYFQGDLCDAGALGAALDRFRAAHGPITHVYHCAGAVNRTEPAFFQKTAASMADVLRPKVDALWVLHDLFAAEPPRELVLFSSISAIAPRLAAGVLDYAAANRYLDHFAAYQRGQGHGHYRSVQWTRWRDTGLARGQAEGLAPADCLEALARIGAVAEPTICVAAAEDPALAPAARERGAAPAARAAVADPAPVAQDFDSARRLVRAMVARELEIAEAKLDDDASFEALGIDSIVLVALVVGLEQHIGRKVDPNELIACDSIARVARFVAANAPAPAPAVAPTAPAPAPAARALPTRSDDRRFEVAVIGIACRFPGAPDRTSFWRNLAGGVDSIATVPASRWSAERLYSRRHESGKTISQWGGFIDGVELIEPSLFGMTAEEAADVDPLIRLFTECSMDALADSPYDRAAVKGRRVGVFAGARGTRYAERIATPRKHSVTGIGQNFIAAYVSHLLDLRGPSLVLDSACSSSLAAVHLACQSLRSGDSELAIAGGVDLLLDEKPYLFLSAAHALSPDGRCRTFDEKANGFVPGEGVGCVVLKPLDRARADGDPIYAVIAGSAMNNDGHTLGITTPGVEGQVDVIERALANAGCSPRQISYVETHGTGTLIGDPIELRALSRAFASDPPERCAVGSVKTNVGHLLSAAGIASFIKVALSLHHRTLPPTLHCDRINPRFDFERSPFFPLQKAEAWQARDGARRAGISAFGFGKTNVHVILSERPDETRAPIDPPVRAARAKVYAWHTAEPSRPANDAELLALEDVSFEESA